MYITLLLTITVCILTSYPYHCWLWSRNGFVLYNFHDLR